MKRLRFIGISVLVYLSAAPVAADWTEVRIHRIGADGAGVELGVVELVDSWFTSLATLLFDISGLAPGTYAVRLHDSPNCDAASPVYTGDGVDDGWVRGQLGEIEVTPGGAVTRTLSLRPPQLVAGADKVTVREMRGHALVIHQADTGTDSRVACGIVPLAEDDPAD